MPNTGPAPSGPEAPRNRPPGTEREDERATEQPRENRPENITDVQIDKPRADGRIPGSEAGKPIDPNGPDAMERHGIVPGRKPANERTRMRDANVGGVRVLSDELGPVPKPASRRVRRAMRRSEADMRADAEASAAAAREAERQADPEWQRMMDEKALSNPDLTKAEGGGVNDPLTAGDRKISENAAEALRDPATGQTRPGLF